MMVILVQLFTLKLINQKKVVGLFFAGDNGKSFANNIEDVF